MRKYILISGSPRKGNTDFILSEIYSNLKGEDKELVRLKDINFGNCLGCLSCYTTDECVQDDDMKKLFNKLLEAELIIIGSPLYYGNVSGLMKNFIDRTIPAYEHALLKNKKIISIMVGGGETKKTAKFHKEAIKGFIKFNQLKLANTFEFQGFEANDLKNNPTVGKEIAKIVKLVESL